MAKASSGGKSSSDLTKEEIEGTTNLFTSLPTRPSIRLSIDRLSVWRLVGSLKLWTVLNIAYAYMYVFIQVGYHGRIQRGDRLSGPPTPQ